MAVGTDGKLWSMAAGGSQRVPFSSSVEVGHYLPVGVPFPLGVSPDESQLAYLERAKRQAPPKDGGSPSCASTTAHQSNHGRSLPAYHPPLFRWSHDGSRGNSFGPKARSSTCGSTTRRRRIEATNQVPLPPPISPSNGRAMGGQ